MSRIRTIKPEFHSNEKLSRLPAETHLLGAALTNYADDEGFFNANPGLVKAATHPLRVDKLSTAEQLDQLEEIGYIERVACADGKTIGWIRNFLEHQRVSNPTGSKLRAVFELGRGSRLPEASVRTPRILRPEGNGTEGNGIGKGTQPADKPQATAAPESSRLPGMETPVFLAMPLVGGRQYPVREAEVESYAAAFPAVNVRQALREVKVWLEAHPRDLNKNGTGLKQRIARWLAKDQRQAMERKGVGDVGAIGGRGGGGHGGTRVERQLEELRKAGVAVADRPAEAGAGPVRGAAGRGDGGVGTGSVLEGVR